MNKKNMVLLLSLRCALMQIETCLLIFLLIPHLAIFYAYLYIVFNASLLINYKLLAQMLKMMG